MSITPTPQLLIPSGLSNPGGPSKEMLLSTGFLLKRLGFAYKEQAHEAFEPTGLQPQHHAVMLLLSEGACRAQGTIADRLGYDRSQLVGLLDELEERGFVTRKRDPGDRRRHLVSLTPAGEKALTEFRVILKVVEKEFFGALDAEERRALHALLLQLAVSQDAAIAPTKP